MPRIEQTDQDRRDQIVDAAFDLIGDVGLQGLRMRDVAAAAGVNISTVHYHVASKAELVRAVVGKANGTFRTHALPPAGTDPVRRMQAHLTKVFDLLLADPRLGRVLAEVALHAPRDPVIAETVAAAERHWLSALRAMLPPGRDSAAFARMVMLTVKGACLPAADPREMRSARRALLHSVELWFQGCRT
ncbi:MAG TPA: TetR/AcrR family transcriptional regulator [Mycobacteriales bacterium]|nr:TetR/AcrR family transcriptional regulator [Mycobacteriales bacterium]